MNAGLKKERRKKRASRSKPAYMFTYLIGSHRKYSFFEAKTQKEVEEEIREALGKENVDGSLVRDCILALIVKRW